MLNYARLTPVYLSQMTELKEKDNDTWQAFQTGHFSVNKSSVIFHNRPHFGTTKPCDESFKRHQGNSQQSNCPR